MFLATSASWDVRFGSAAIADHFATSASAADTFSGRLSSFFSPDACCSCFGFDAGLDFGRLLFDIAFPFGDDAIKRRLRFWWLCVFGV
jgi:hypothetical protein